MVQHGVAIFLALSFFWSPVRRTWFPPAGRRMNSQMAKLRPYLYIGRRTELCSICIVGARCRSRAPQAWKMLLLWSWTAPLSNKTLSSEIESWSSPRAGQVRPVRVEGWRNGCPWIAVWSATLGSETQYHEEVKSLMFHFIKQAQELKAGNQNLQSSSVATSRRSASHGMG